MKIVVIGGSGLIGSKLIKNLRLHGHDAVSASPSSGVNAFTGEGLANALKNADVVVDVANSPSFEDKAVLEFFKTSTQHILSTEAAAGVGHHIALSVVGTDLLEDCGYFRAKLAQENLIKASKIPYTIVRSTQFFEFLNSIADSGAKDKNVHLSPAFVQPIASDDVASALADIVTGKPVNGIVEIAGPERMRLSDLVQRHLVGVHDPRQVIADTHAPYFGAELSELTLVPLHKARLGKIGYEEWFKAQKIAKA